MKDIMKALYDFIVDNGLIILLLSLDTVRAFVSSLGIIDRNVPVLGRILYGKYDVGVLKEALKELGYGKENAEKIVDGLKNDKKVGNTFPLRDTGRRLVFVLSKHILEFRDEISYGLIAPQKTLSYSKYYINTMDAVHNSSDLDDLTTIMVRLIDSIIGDRKIDFIIVPKGGNPLLAQNIARRFNLLLIIAKDQNDSARPPDNIEEAKIFTIRYEGLNELLKKDSQGTKKKYRGIVLDCNTSGGTQLTNIVQEFNRFVDACGCNVEHLSQVYVLFKLVKINKESKKEIKIDQQFLDIGCQLYRFFDLDEDDKERLAGLPGKDYYEELEKIDSIIDKIQEKKRYYYKAK